MHVNKTKQISSIGFHRFTMLALLASTPLAGGMFATPAVAQAQTSRNYNIPAGALPTALGRFIEASGASLVYDAGLANGLTSPGIKGRYGTAEALNKLLAGTGLTYRQNEGGSFTIERAPRVASNAVQLGTLRVEGASGTNDGNILSGRGERFGDGGDTGDLAYVSAQSSSYINHEEIERNRGTQPSDMFRGTPGVLSGDSRNSGALDINIRGMQGMGRVPVVIDGAQHSTTVYRGYSGVASRTYVDPDMIGGVEVFKGPTSGADAVGGVGGVVRMRTIMASDIVLPGNSFGIRVRGGFNTNTREAPEPFTRGGLQASMLGSYRVGCNYDCGALVTPPTIESVNSLGNPRGLSRPSWAKPTDGNGSIAIAKKWDAIDVVAAVTYRNTGNYFAGTQGNAPHITYTERTAPASRGREIYFIDVGYGRSGLNRFRAGEEVLNTSSENLSFLVKANIRPTDDQAIEVSYSNFQSWFGEQMPSSIIRGDGALQSPMSKVNLDTYSFRHKWDPDSSLIELRTNITRTELDNAIRTAYDFSNLDPTLKFIQPYDARTHRTSVDISNRSEFLGPLGALTINVGGSFSYETTYKIPGSAETTADGTPRDGWRREWSGFGDFEWSPVDFLKFNGAMRYTKFESFDRKEQQQWIAAENRLGDPFNVSHNRDGWAPIGAITLSPRSWLQVYARYAEAIRMPSLFEVTAGWSQSPSLTADVRPERARNWEFGINVSKDGLFFGDDAVRAKLTYFNNDIKDYLTRSAGGLDYNDRTEMVRNIDRAYFKGYEASLEYRTGPIAVELFGTHYTKTEFCYYKIQGTATRPQPSIYECSAGVPASYGRNHIPPEWAGGASASLDLFNKKLNLFGRVTYTGGRPDEAIAAPGAIAVVEWDAYTLVDTTVTYKHNDNLKFSLTADNLLDKYYMDALTLGLMASPGRIIRAGVTLNF